MSSVNLCKNLSLVLSSCVNACCTQYVLCARYDAYLVDENNHTSTVAFCAASYGFLVNTPLPFSSLY